MRTFVILLAFICSIISCNNKAEDSQPVIKGKALASLPIAPEKIKGTYLGDFKGSPIAITLNYVSDHHASGYNVHKGLTRNINGSVEARADGLHLLLSEPGNNQYDGQFDLLIDTSTWTGKGTWKPFKKGDAASFRFKKQFAPTDEEQYEMVFTDSLLNTLTLKTDGSCTYSYLTDTTVTGQQLTVRGNYTKENKTINIFWQKNAVFPLKSTFKLTEEKPYKDDDYVEITLKGEGKVFTQMWD